MPAAYLVLIAIAIGGLLLTAYLRLSGAVQVNPLRDRFSAFKKRSSETPGQHAVRSAKIVLGSLLAAAGVLAFMVAVVGGISAPLSTPQRISLGAAGLVFAGCATLATGRLSSQRWPHH